MTVSIVSGDVDFDVTLRDIDPSPWIRWRTDEFFIESVQLHGVELYGLLSDNVMANILGKAAKEWYSR